MPRGGTSVTVDQGARAAAWPLPSPGLGLSIAGALLGLVVLLAATAIHAIGVSQALRRELTRTGQTATELVAVAARVSALDRQLRDALLAPPGHAPQVAMDGTGLHSFLAGLAAGLPEARKPMALLLGERVQAWMTQVRSAETLLGAGHREDALALLRAGDPAASAPALEAALLDLAQSLTDPSLTGPAPPSTRPQRLAFWTAIGSAILAALLLAVLGALAHGMAAEQRRMRALLAQSQEAAVAAERARSRFLGAAGHDLRQPLQALELFVTALDRQIQDPEARQIIGKVRAATAAMSRMFGGLLDISKLDAGIVAADRVDFPIGEVLQGLRTEFTALAEAKGLRFHVSAGEWRVHTDPALLERILRNLIANAIKYTEAGEVAVACRMAEGALILEVVDTGPGIPPGEQAAIFQEFHRVRGTSADGLGLGLAIVRRLADLLGLRVALRSAPGSGSIFSVTLPLAGPAAATAHVPGHGATAAASGGPPQVLLVEDDALLREALAQEFRARGLAVTGAGSAAGAIALFEAQPPLRPDLLLVDRDLGPGLTGIELLDQLAARHGVASPALVLTGTGDPEALAELTDCGYPWVAKPVEPDALLAMIEMLLKRAGPVGAAA